MKNHNLFLALDNQTVKSLSIQSINWISSVYNHEHIEYSNISSVYLLKHVSYSAASACLLVLSFLDLIFFDSNFHAHFSLSFCLTDLILMFEILIKSIITNSYSVLCHVFFEKSLICLSFFITFCFIVWDFSQAFCYKLLFNLVQHFWERSLFAFSNFRTANFSSVCIQYMKMNLANLIDKDLISSVNQIQLKAGNQL